MKRILAWSAVVSFAAPAIAADVILNEYNAVSDSQVLQNGGSDPFWGIIQGNGGDWFELVVITDHLDMRGWSLEMIDATNMPLTLTLTNHAVWSDLRSGTIITISEDLENNADDYNPVLGRWWLNVRAATSTDGTYITASNFFANNDNWRLTIRDAASQIVFGPAGEGVQPLSGVGNNEVCKLEENPTSLITPTSNYNDGSSSTFGLPNVWSSGTNQQDFSVLRSVVPYFPLTSVRINEVLAHTDPPLEDFIELHNTTAAPVDISGWYLTDDHNNLMRFTIPPATVIPANGFVVFYASQLMFGLSELGETAILSQADSMGALTGGRDFLEFGASSNGVSIGRYPDAVGRTYALSSRTPGAANAPPLVGPVVINELMYHPPDLAGGVDNVDHEFVELHNVTDAPVELSTFFASSGTTEPWRMTGGVDFDFAVGSAIPPRGFLLVVSFDPLTDAVRLDSFRTQYGLDATIPIVGPYDGQLSNGGETVRLRKPETPEPPPNPFVPYVLVDEVPYDDIGPWPLSPDGAGPSLERIDPNAVGDVASNWTASALAGGTPGCPNDQESPVPGDINGDGVADMLDVARFVDLLLDAPATQCERERADLAPDTLLNGADIAPFVAAILP